MKRYLIEEMTPEEITEALRVVDTVLVPLGKIEQHGPHLPVGTDVIVPMEIAKRVAEKAKVLVAPPIYYGNSLSMQEIRELSRSLPKPSQPCSLTYVSLLRNRVLGRSCS